MFVTLAFLIETLADLDALDVFTALPPIVPIADTPSASLETWRLTLEDSLSLVWLCPLTFAEPSGCASTLIFDVIEVSSPLKSTVTFVELFSPAENVTARETSPSAPSALPTPFCKTAETASITDALAVEESTDCASDDTSAEA